MRRTAAPLIFALTLLIFALLPAAAKADEITATSKVSAVTVFQNGARVTRTATIDIPAGQHTVLLEDIPPNADPSFMTVAGSAGAKVILGALTHKWTTRPELTAPREKELQDEITKLEDRKSEKEVALSAFNTEKAFYEKLAATAGERIDDDISTFNLDPDTWTLAAKSVSAGVLNAMQSALKIKQEIRVLDKEIKSLREELARLGNGSRHILEVCLPIESAAATTLALTLEYTSGNVSWGPAYEARLTTDTATPALTLEQFGLVYQKTGEDWTDIDLTLSTAQPGRGIAPPRPSPMWVDFMPEIRAKRHFSSNFSESAIPEMAMMDAVEEMEGSVEQAYMAAPMPAQIDTGEFLSTYKIPGPVTITADGSESRVLVGSYDTETLLARHAYPQWREDVFLIAKTKLAGNATLPAGQVSLFRDGIYLGKTHLSMLRPGEEVDLAFGTDDYIAITRETLENEHGEKGMINREQSRTHRLITKFESRRNKPVALRVFETVPAPRDEDIKLSILKDATTPGYEQDAEDIKNLLVWDLDIPAGETSALNLGWTLTWPQDKNITGIR